MAASMEFSTEPLLQERTLTRTETLIQASWLEAVEELKKRNHSKFPTVVPDVIFEEDKVYLPSQEYMQDISPEMYAEIEHIFDEVVLKPFDEHRLTPEFVGHVTHYLWKDFGELTLGHPDSSKPFIDVMNKIEIEDDISQTDDPFVKQYNYDKIKAIISHFNSQYIEYDIILYINMHGVIVGKLNSLPVIKLPDDMKVTFLAYAKLGECSFVSPRLYIQIHEIFDRTNVTGVDIHRAVKILRKQKFNTTTSQKKLNVAAHGEKYTRQSSDEGWNIYTQCVDRFYKPEDNPYGRWVPFDTPFKAIEVLYDSQDKLNQYDIFTALSLGRPYIMRSELINCLYTNGYKNPLFVDISCAISADLRDTSNDLRALRAARRAHLPSSVREGIAGGKKTHRKKRKLRRKSKKYIHK